MWTLLLNPLFLAAFLTGCHSQTGSEPHIQLGDTTLIGRVLQPYNFEFFGGIPFAEPPIGDRRFSPPEPKYSLSPLQSFDARDFGLPCLQPQFNGTMSEDCLTINVFRSSGVGVNSSLPVMAWIHGGGFLTGASSLHDGTPLVGQSVARGTPIIFVSFNYRLGPLGFPQGPEAVERRALNLGLHDQWVALQWVQKNIALFGGDPRKVTVFGESAGAMSAFHHSLNEDFSTVARATIFESGTASSLSLFDGYHETPSWMLFANSIQSCATASENNTFSCLRSASSSDLVPAITAGLALETYPFHPVLDGPGGIISDYPAKRLSCGASSHVPLMIGTNLDEGTLFITPQFQTEDVSMWLNANATPSPLGADALRAGMDRVMSLYSRDPSAGSPYGTGNQTFGTGTGYKWGAAVLGDIHYHAPRRFWTQTLSAPSYAYLFTDPQPNANPAIGVFHTTELPYLFGNVSTAAPPKVANLSRAMLDYWISFAVSLTPNDGKGTKRPHWGMYKKTKGLLELNSNGMRMIPDQYRAASIEFIIGLRDMLSW